MSYRNHRPYRIVHVLRTPFCCGFIIIFGDSHSHDDVIKWKHFQRYFPFVRGIYWSPVDSPHKGQWRRALTFSLICARTKGWADNRDTIDLSRFCAHYDVTVMVNLLIFVWVVSMCDQCTYFLACDARRKCNMKKTKSIMLSQQNYTLWYTRIHPRKMDLQLYGYCLFRNQCFYPRPFGHWHRMRPCVCVCVCVVCVCCPVRNQRCCCCNYYILKGSPRTMGDGADKLPPTTAGLQFPETMAPINLLNGVGVEIKIRMSTPDDSQFQWKLG